MLECVREMIRMEDVQSPVVPAMVQFFLNMEERMQKYGETLNEICLELCGKAGSIDGVCDDIFLLQLPHLKYFLPFIFLSLSELNSRVS